MALLNFLLSDEYPPSAFYFSVGFSQRGLLGLLDTSFQDVSGIGSEMDTEDVVEGGENRYVHRLPKGVKHSTLVLKRGIATMDSPLVTWCRDVLEADLASSIKPKEMTISLLNEFKDPIRSWSFANVYPVNWEVENFNSTKNEVAIESIELSYTTFNRLI